MSTAVHRLPAFEIRGLHEPWARVNRAQRLRLRPTADGWSLIRADGDVVFRAMGTRARRACLEYAREHGIAAVFS